MSTAESLRAQGVEVETVADILGDNPFDTPEHAIVEKRGNVSIYRGLIQGSEEWHRARLGLLTASEMSRIVTPTLKAASNDKERSHLWELLAQRITGYVEPHYISDDMLRGREDEVDACIAYSKHYALVDNVGFITNDKFGFTIGYSPDGLVGDDGLIECKSRRQRFQAETIVNGQVPVEYMIQLQTGLLVSERKWIDFVSYSGGLPMVTMRVEPIAEYQDAIIAAATAFEARLVEKLDAYEAAMASEARLIPTERKIETEMYI
jgi:predicted phage-related endonuclease